MRLPPIISHCRLLDNPIPVEGFIKCPKGQVFQLMFDNIVVGAIVGALKESRFHILCMEILGDRLLEGHLVNLGVEYLEADEVEPEDAPFWVKTGFVALETENMDSLTYQKTIRIIQEASS